MLFLLSQDETQAYRFSRQTTLPNTSPLAKPLGGFLFQPGIAVHFSAKLRLVSSEADLAVAPHVPCMVVHHSQCKHTLSPCWELG